MGLNPPRHLFCRRRLTVVGAVVLLAGTLSGCATDRFIAADLPVEYQAQLTENSQTLELAKIASPTVQNDVIGPEDVLEINISTGFNSRDQLPHVVRVAEDGTALIGPLGRVNVEGLELVTAEAMIASLCVEKGLYQSPQVTVTMKSAKTNRVTVIGAVTKAATYHLRSGSSTLLDAIVAAGGLAEDAGTNVEIRHPGYRNSRTTPRIAALGDQDVVNVSHENGSHAKGTQTVKVDLISATEKGQGGYYLPDGAIVNVERRDPLPIHVAGLVNKAGSYDFPMGKEMTLLDAIAEAGGISNPIANKIFIIRAAPGHEKPILIEASLRKAKHNLGLDNPRLAPGDYVSVEQTPGTALYEAVRLIGFGVSGRAF